MKTKTKIKSKTKQLGFVPLVVVAALISAALVGGYLGFKLGDGTFFSFGLGVGVILVLAPIISNPLKRLVKSVSSDKKNG